MARLISHRRAAYGRLMYAPRTVRCVKAALDRDRCRHSGLTPFGLTMLLIAKLTVGSPKRSLPPRRSDARTDYHLSRVTGYGAGNEKERCISRVGPHRKRLQTDVVGRD